MDVMLDFLYKMDMKMQEQDLKINNMSENVVSVKKGNISRGRNY